MGGVGGGYECEPKRTSRRPLPPIKLSKAAAFARQPTQADSLVPHPATLGRTRTASLQARKAQRGKTRHQNPLREQAMPRTGGKQPAVGDPVLSCPQHALPHHPLPQPKYPRTSIQQHPPDPHVRKRQEAGPQDAPTSKDAASANHVPGLCGEGPPQLPPPTYETTATLALAGRNAERGRQRDKAISVGTVGMHQVMALNTDLQAVERGRRAAMHSPKEGGELGCAQQKGGSQ